MSTYTIEQLQNKIKYQFKNTYLLTQAITHSSFSNEKKVNKPKDYERVEFLGDAVLELVSSEFFYHKYPNAKEGEMTKMRASSVCEQALCITARQLEIGRFLLMGKGEELTGGRERNSIIADVVEAIIGAIYLDGGLEPAKQFIIEYVLSDLEQKQLFYDAKTTLQEYVQDLGKTLSYKEEGTKGPDHCKEFIMGVYIGDECFGTGCGNSKKTAQQEAAYHALLSIKNNKK